MRPLGSCTYNRSTAPLARSARACKAHLQSGERILISIEETNVITCSVDVSVFCCCWCCPYKLECVSVGVGVSVCVNADVYNDMCVSVVRNENSVDRGSFHVCVDVSVRVRFGLCYRW